MRSCAYVKMTSNDRHYRDQTVTCSESKNTPLYVSSSGRGRQAAVDAYHHGTSGPSHLPGCSSKSSLMQGRHLGLSDGQLRLVDCDRWSVDSPRESGYYSEESSVGHSTEMATTTTTSSNVHPALHRSKSFSIVAVHCVDCKL